VSFPTVCARKRDLKPITAPRHIQGVGDDSSCVPERHRFKCLTKPRTVDEVLGVSVPYAHKPCCHNELVALHNRVMNPKYEVTLLGELFIGRAMKCVMRGLEGICLVKLSRRAYVDSVRDPSKKRRYEKAKTNLDMYGFLDKYGAIELMIKVEPIDGVVKGSADPRPIQFRKPEFNVEYGRFIKPIEKFIVAYDFASAFGFQTYGRVIAKGLNNVQRGRLIAEKVSRFRNVVVLGVDASRFDQSVSIPWLAVCHSIYMKLFGNDPELKRLFDVQLANRGWTHNGIYYEASGGRASGDQDTGLGNSIITCLLVAMFLKQEMDLGRITMADWLCDGDDGLIFVERDEMEGLADRFASVARNAGFDMKIEDPVYELSDVEFCQCHPIEVVPGKFVMVRNPRRAIQRALMSNSSMGNLPQALQVMYAVGECELSLHSGIPIMQEFALWCKRNGKRCSHKVLNAVRMKNHSYWELPASTGTRQVSDAARESMARAFGITPNDQIELERLFATHVYESWEVREGVVDEDKGHGPIIVEPYQVYV